MSGLQKGGLTGNAQAALGAGSLANRYYNGTSASTSELGGALGAAGGALGIYNGLQQGGVAGYGGALAGGLQVGAGVATMAGDTALAGTLGSAAGAIAIPLAVYNFANNWQSGKTGSDALSGAEAGAAIGSAIPAVGTVIGAVAGGAIGALSSAFGPGATDPEQASFGSFLNAYTSGGTAAQNAEMTQAGVGKGAQISNPGIARQEATNPLLQQYASNMATKTYLNAPAATAAYDAGGAQAVAGATGTQDWQALAGLFDARSSDLPFYQQYGRMGEGQFMTNMTSQINDAIDSGKISSSATPQEIFSQVVNPWIGSMNNSTSSTGKGWDTAGTTADPGGIYQAPVEQLLTNLIGNYQQGQPMYNVGGDQANFGVYA
jgi:hypothetical protein